MGVKLVFLVFMIFGQIFFSYGVIQNIFLPDKSMYGRLIDAESEPFIVGISLEDCCSHCMPMSCSAVFYNTLTTECLRRRNVDLVSSYMFGSHWTYFTRLVPTFDFSTDWYYTTPGIYQDVDTYIVIDGTQKPDSKWYDSDGSEVKYLNWMYNQPNNLDWQTKGNQTTLTIYSIASYKLNDMWNVMHGYQFTYWMMCEFDY